MTKDIWMLVAERIDHYRIFPRAVLFAYGYYVYNVTFFILQWYASQPKEGRGTEESAVVIAIVSAVTGFAPWIFRIYSDNATDWSARPPTITTSSSTTTTATGPPVS
jgi:chloramphenicol O-acetyltransferase